MKYAVVPARLAPLTLLTSHLLPGGLTHIKGHNLILWAFGRSLEDAMGHGKFLSFYLLCGVIAGIAQLFFVSDPRIPTVGASGAIAGVMGAYLLRFPRAWIHTLVVVIVFITTVEIPAWFFTIFWFITQLFNGVGSIATTQVSGGGTAWFAHIGGFIAGMILVSVMGTRNRYVRRHVEDRW
jgi:membrane associated rhomboid family serine protease